MPENHILKIIADNPMLMEAVKGAIMDEFERVNVFSKFQISVTLSNEQLGQATRARLDGIEIVESAFAKMAQYKTQPQNQEVRNPAR